MGEDSEELKDAWDYVDPLKWAEVKSLDNSENRFKRRQVEPTADPETELAVAPLTLMWPCGLCIVKSQ